MHSEQSNSIWSKLHIDLPLLGALLVLMAVGLGVIYSAGGQETALVYRQITRLGLAVVVMLVVIGVM